MNFIYKTVPRHTEDLIPLDQSLEVYFMVDINVASFKEENIILLNITEKVVEPFQFTYSRRMLRVTPENKLKPNTHYQLTVVGDKNGIKDITGLTMPESYELEIFTKDVDAVKPPLLLTPTDTSVLKEAAEFVFNSVENAHYYELQISKSNTFNNLVWPTNESKIYDQEKITVTPNINYETNTYYARIRSVTKDGEQSSWSATIRYHFNNEVVIEVAPEIPFPGTPPIEEEESQKSDLDANTSKAKKTIVLRSKSRGIYEESQLANIQKALSAATQEEIKKLLIKSSTPEDGQIHNSIAKLNNNKEFIVEFTDNLDADSVNKQTCYLLEERN